MFKSHRLSTVTAPEARTRQKMKRMRCMNGSWSANKIKNEANAFHDRLMERKQHKK
jgi:hypothetical protein